MEGLRRTFETMQAMGVGPFANGGPGANRGGNQGGAGSPGNGGGPGGNWNNSSADQRESWMKNMLSSTTPEQRAAMDQFRTALMQRREQRGMANPGGFGR